MRVSHTFLTLGASAGCWMLAAALTAAPETQGVRGENPLAIRRSGYGSFAARLMKDSMHNYWHAGCADPSPGHSHEQVETAARNLGEAAGGPKSWLQRSSEQISEWEEHRKAAPKNFKIRAAHRQYLEATAARYVRAAYHLDPGDAALYEILHYTEISRAGSPERAVQVSEILAKETIAHALSPVGGCSSALTGAGAAINLLNNEMQAGAPLDTPPERLRRHWEMLSECLKRYHTLRQAAISGGWWESIPTVRRREIESYAGLIEKLSGGISRKLRASGVLN